MFTCIFFVDIMFLEGNESLTKAADAGVITYAEKKGFAETGRMESARRKKVFDGQGGSSGWEDLYHPDFRGATV